MTWSASRKLSRIRLPDQKRRAIMWSRLCVVVDAVEWSSVGWRVPYLSIASETRSVTIKITIFHMVVFILSYMYMYFYKTIGSVASNVVNSLGYCLWILHLSLDENQNKNWNSIHISDFRLYCLPIFNFEIKRKQNLLSPSVRVY